MNQEIQNSLMYWENYYRNNNQEAIIYDNWLDVYIEKINKTQNPILDLGCGSGNDTLYLIKYGNSKNMPTQRAMEMKLFEIKERTHQNPDGSVLVTRTTVVTGKGQIYFVNKFLGNK